jgi:hypothetical protein
MSMGAFPMLPTYGTSCRPSARRMSLWKKVRLSLQPNQMYMPNETR